jgi:hypothetical protein
MDVLCTLDNLIRFIYKETEEGENNRIKYSIYRHTEIRQDYNSLKETTKYLDTLRISPDKELVSNVLQYSEIESGFIGI